MFVLQSKLKGDLCSQTENTTTSFYPALSSIFKCVVKLARPPPRPAHLQISIKRKKRQLFAHHLRKLGFESWVFITLLFFL